MTQRIDLRRPLVKYNKSVAFNDWISENCKSSTDGLNVQDIDFFFHDFKNEHKPYMFIEVKQFAKIDIFGTRTPRMKPGQFAQFGLLHKVCESSDTDFEYRGFFEVSISGETPDVSDSILLIKHFDARFRSLEFEISKQQLLKFLNFEITFDELIRG